MSEDLTGKALVTVGGDGFPHAQVTELIHTSDDGRIVYLEIDAASQTSTNLRQSLWFGWRVSVALKGFDGAAIEIKARPERSLQSGPLFEAIRKVWLRENPDIELAAVWELLPLEIVDHRQRLRAVNVNQPRVYVARVH